METAVKLDELPEMMSVEQAGAYLGISRSTAYAWCVSGDMPSFKVANTRRVRKSALIAWINAGESIADGQS